MGRYRCYQTVLNVAYCLLVFCVADLRPLLIGGVFKLIISLALVCLLAFVVVQLPNMYKLLAAFLRPLPIPVLPLMVDGRRTGRSQTNILIPNEPSLSPLFQRPPPVLSL